MSNKLPFEDAFEQQMNNLPVPGEDGAWAKMEALLNNNEKRRPAVFFRKHLVWGMLLLLFVPAGFWITLCTISKTTVHTKENAAIQKKDTPKAGAHHLPAANESGLTPLPTSSDTNSIEPARNTPTAEADQTGTRKQQTIITTNNGKTKAGQNRLQKVRVVKTSLIVVRTRSLVKKPGSANKSTALHLAVTALDKRNGTFVTKTGAPGNMYRQKTTINNKMPFKNSRATEAYNMQSATKIDTLHPVAQKVTNTIPLLITEQKSSISPAPAIPPDATTNATAQPTADPLKSVAATKLLKYAWSAGIGLQQQIPVSGQQAVHYGHNGTSGITDYIPSIYVRFQRKQQWYLQGGFSYGSPQLVKSFVYNRQSEAVSNSVFATTSLRLRKTFYSELPLSFNYFVRPRLSVGIGGMYSWFHGAISEKETLTKNSQTQAQSVVREIVPIKGFTDSFLYRSHTYMLLQTNYEWKRMSIGVRYSKDLQPYIRYSLPDGTITDQKNWSLEGILQVRLWKKK